MNKYQELFRQLDNNHTLAYSLIRIFLGTALFIRGWILVTDPSKLIELVSDENLHVWYSYIAIGHLLGGLMIAIGLFTRLGALFQVPILFSAVFVVHAGQGLMMTGQSLELAVLVLFLLVVYAVFGSGTLSLTEYFEKKQENDQEQDGATAKYSRHL